MKSRISRRDVFRTGGMAAAAGLTAAAPAAAASTKTGGPDVYTRIGVRPFINATATLTINGGSRMLPEVIAAIEQASNYHVNLDDLMEKTGQRLAQLLQVEWGIVTSGAAGALTHGAAACVAGADPEKMQRLPNLEGLKNEVIFPKESRNVYDHATRTTGIKVVEVASPEELEAAIGPRTAMIQILGSHFGTQKFGLKEVAPIAKKAGIPILVDAAADYLITPNPYLALGADMVAYSGGKILRGPQTAGLLLGRKDLVRAAWANSAPHHAFGRAMKVSKEEIVGMLTAVEVWVSQRDIKAEYKEWESWYAHISGEITKVPGVKTQVRGPARGGPFPVLQIQWDPEKIGLTAGEVGQMLVEGEPSIMTHANGEGHSFMVRPVALKPGEYKIIAQRVHEIFRKAPGPRPKPQAATAAVDLTGRWDVEIQYDLGSAQHKLFLTAKGNQVRGTHFGWAFEGDVKGQIEGDKVHILSALPAGGARLPYIFAGLVSDTGMSGIVDLGEYGQARFTARRHNLG